MSKHIEFFKNVDVTWDKEINFLSINDEKGIQLAALFVEKEG